MCVVLSPTFGNAVITVRSNGTLHKTAAPTGCPPTSPVKSSVLFPLSTKEKAITVDTLVASKRIEREQWFTFYGCCLWGKREVYS